MLGKSSFKEKLSTLLSNHKTREIILYVFFGGLTTIVSIVIFLIFTRLFLFNAVISNVISWIISVCFAYLTNRKWVFVSKKSGLKAIGGEVIAFFASRSFSGLIETAIIYIFVDILGLYDLAVKIAATVIVIILNYILSKIIVFRNNTK